MALILSIETSMDVCSVAIHEKGKLLKVLEISTPRSHAAQLGVLIQKTCEEAACPPGKLHAIAVSAGPGSYTGLRIGVSTAKGLCYGLNVPLIAVNTLDVIARQTRHQYGTGAWLCPLIDARRMDVFCKLIDGNDREVIPTAAITLHPEHFRKYLDEGYPIVFSGNAAEKCKTVIKHPQALFISDIYPSATVLGELAFEKWSKGHLEDAAQFEPLYAKEFFTTVKD